MAEQTGNCSLVVRRLHCPPLRHTSQTFKKAPKTVAKSGAASLFDESDHE